MAHSKSDTWYPSDDYLTGSNIAEIIKLFGVADYDALYRYSIEQPDAYWQKIVDYCGIVWSKPYSAYADLSRGKEFPTWFVDGELNWTDTALALADDPSRASRIAVIAENEAGEVTRVTYGELKTRVQQFASGLLKVGIKRGDRIGFLLEPGVEAVVTFLAISYIGAIVLPLFTGFGADAAMSRLSGCGARALIATSGFRRRGNRIDTAKVAVESCDALSIEFLIVKRAPGEALTVPKAIDWHEVAAAPVTVTSAARMTSRDPFMVIYTSGTTGKPKGAVHTHGGYPLKIAHDSAVHFEVRPGDVYFWPADMGWIAGALMITSALMRGASMLCYDGAPDFPDWSRMSRLVERHRVTHFASAPTMIRGLAKEEKLATAGDLSSIRILITGGEAIDPEHFIWFQNKFGRGIVPIINYSGGTEVSGALLSSVVVKPIRAGGFNTASPAVVIDVVNHRGEPVVDEIGELAILEPFVGMTQSFWQDDARYLETYWQTVPGMWIHGDLAIRSSAGGFFLRGRSDDTIKLAGKRLGPAEVEEITLELEEVSEAAAIGVDDAAKGQMLVIFAIPSDSGRTATDLPGTISRHVDSRMGRAFRPGRVHIVDQLPKTRTSKVMRRLIRSVYCGVPPGDLSSLDNPAALDEIRRLLAGGET